MCGKFSPSRERARAESSPFAAVAVSQLWHCHRSENPLRPFSPLQQRGRRRVGKLASQPAVKDFSCRIFLHAHTHTLSQVLAVFTGWKEKKKLPAPKSGHFSWEFRAFRRNLVPKVGLFCGSAVSRSFRGSKIFRAAGFQNAPKKKRGKVGEVGRKCELPDIFSIRGGKRRYQNTVSEGEVQPKVRVELVLG